jgi:hypothetical protein
MKDLRHLKDVAPLRADKDAAAEPEAARQRPSLDTLSRRWTVNFYWRYCFKTNDAESRFSRTKLEPSVDSRPRNRNVSDRYI